MFSEEHAIMSDGGAIAGTAGTVLLIKTLLEQTSIYQDAIQPAARAFGNAAKPAGAAAGRTVAKLARAVEDATGETLSAISIGYGLVKARLAECLAEKLRHVPQERIVQPHPIVAVPTIDALSYSASEPTLSELYLNLLATAMDRETVLKAHPRFVEIIRQITPDEARMIERFAIRGKYNRLTCYPNTAPVRQADRSQVLPDSLLLACQCGCSHPQMGAIYLENLRSLGILVVPDGVGTVFYTPSSDMPEEPGKLAAWFLEGGGQPRSQASSGPWINLTGLGERFIEACVRRAELPTEQRWTINWD